MKMLNNINSLETIFEEEEIEDEEPVIAKADSGASNHYVRGKDKKCLKDVRKDSGPPVTLPLGNKVTSNEAGHLPIEDLPPHATKARVIDDLQSASLVSLGQLTDGGCKVHLD